MKYANVPIKAGFLLQARNSIGRFCSNIGIRELVLVVLRKPPELIRAEV